MTVHSLSPASPFLREGRRWVALSLLLVATISVVYVGTTAALVDGFLRANELPCGQPCVSISHGDLANVVALLEDQGRYWAASDIYFPRVLLIDLGVALLSVLAVAVGRPVRHDRVYASVRAGAWVTLLLGLLVHMAFWEAIEFATVVTE